MIKRFYVEKLFGDKSLELKLHPDLNIITGRNGTGKTTILKLMWYMLSSNLERVIPEVKFKYAELITDKFTIQLKHLNNGKTEILLKVKGKVAEKERISETSYRSSSQVESINRRLVLISGDSVFFPTFRRIEGGFSISDRRPSHFEESPSGQVGEALREYANRMTAGGHKFVSSISTEDIEGLLLQKYANVSEKTNFLHKEVSQKISVAIKEFKKHTGNVKDPITYTRETLNKIEKIAANSEKDRERLHQPFTQLSELIGKVFETKSIKVRDITLGDYPKKILASKLSAGEKQMLSFMVYNAFLKKAPFFVDEPEISLHVDWQRILVPTLMSQESGNQFILATHSPMIYSKYQGKELDLDSLLHK